MLRQDPACRSRRRRSSRRGPATVGSGWSHAAVVGRARELAALRDAVHDAARGEGRTLLMLGESGIGKTRLAGRPRSLPASAG
ncbi:ATP-binding protein [Micromonospora sp. M12]